MKIKRQSKKTEKQDIDSSNMKQFVSYFFVGGAATLVEWAGFWLFSNCLQVQYLLATTLAFIISTFANWLFGRLWAFKNVSAKHGIWGEIASIYLASVIGLLFNLLLMWIFVERVALLEMLAKMLATVIVFIYNYLIRKLVIYRQ